MIVATAIACGVGADVAAEQTYSWLGAVGGPGPYKWSGAGNWSGGIAPPLLGASDVVLVFDGAPAGLSSTNDLGKFSLNRLQFGTTAGNYVVAGPSSTEPLEFLAAGATAPALVNDSNSAIALSHAIAFNAGLELGGTGTGSLALTGDLFGRGVLTKSGPGNATLNSSGADLQLERLAVTGGALNISAGTQVLANTATNPSTFSTVTGGATIHIDGVGSKLVGRFSSQSSDTSGTIHVTGGGRLETFGSSGTLWGRTGAGRSVVVDGSGSTWEHTSTVGNHQFQINGGATTITLSNGGAFTTSKNVFLGNGARLIVDGGTATVPSLRSFSGTEGPGVIELSDGASGTSALTIFDAQLNGEIFDFNDTIIDASGGPGSVTMLDGEQALNNLTNTFSGGTRLLGGYLYVPGNGALGSGGVFLNGGALIFAGGTLERTLTFGPNGGQLGGSLIVNQTLNLTAPLSIFGGGTVRLTAANQYDSLSVDGTLELTNDADATVSGTVTGNGGRLSKFGDGVLTFSEGVADGFPVNGAYVGVHEGAIRLLHRQALNAAILDVVRDDPLLFDLGPNPVTVPMRGLIGTKRLDMGPHSIVLNEDGQSSFVDFTGTITGTGSVTVQRGGRLMGTNAHTGGTYLEGGTLTLVPSKTTGDIIGIGPIGPLAPSLYLQQDTDGTYAGNISGNLRVFKTGSGMLTMTGADNSNASYEIFEGGLAMRAGPTGNFTAFDSITALHAGTTFRALSDGGLFNFWFLQNSTLDTNGHRVEIKHILFGASMNQTIATKTGAGVLSVGNAIAHTVRVDDGTLELTDMFDVVRTEIADSASLVGIATGLTQVVLESGGTIAPGLASQPVGTISAGGLLWDSGGTLQFDLATANATDRLALTGMLDKGATETGDFLFDFSVADSVDAGLYQLVTFGATDFDVDDFDYVGLPAGGVGEFELQAGALYFHLTVLEGDYNLDGFVDAADYTVWRNSFGQSGTGLAADGNGNGGIDDGDYGIWKTHFGEAAGGGARSRGISAIPEPAGWLLVLASPLVLLLDRRATRMQRSSGDTMSACAPRK